MKKSNSKATLTIVILFAAFVLIAMPGAIPGVGWPAIRDEFGLRQDSVGLLLVMGTIGHFISAAFNGRLMYIFGGKNLLFIALVCFAGSLFGYGLSPTWYFLVTMGLIGGWAAGTIDATGNTIVAAQYNERIMNWLHGFFGVGAALGPSVLLLVVSLGSDWRGGALLFGGLTLLVFVIMIISNPMGGETAETGHTTGSEESNMSGFTTLRQPVVWVALLFFFIYGGIEVSIGQWAFTIFTESRGLSDELSSILVSVYWGTFTAGRFLFGIISPWLPTKTWLRGCVILTAGSLVLFLFPDSQFLGVAALALSGITIAPIFATLITMMPKLVGDEHASNAIGYVVGAAGVGIAILPSLGGVLAEQISLEAIPPFILSQAIVLILIFELLMRQRSVQAVN